MPVMKARVRKTLGVLLLGAVLSCIGCAASSDTAGAKGPYGSWSENTVFTHTMKLSSGSASLVSSKIVGSKTINSENFPVYQIGDAGMAQTVGGKAYIKKLDDSHFRFAGGEVYSPLGTPGTPYFSGEVTQPVDLAIDPPIGADQTVTLTGTLIAPGQTTAQNVTLNGTYKLIADDESVTTAMGVIHNCRHFSAKATFLDAPIEGELWYHDQYGIVAAKVPAYNLDTTFVGTNDMGDPNATGGVNVIRKMSVVKVDNQGFSLDTYDRKKQFDADKMSHAKMLVELRWLDETQAKTELQPNINLTFIANGGLGYFPHTFVRSPISLFHPEENGKGYVYWVAYVDQAQKNETAAGGVSYGVKSTSYDPNGAVRTTARIVYHLVDPTTGQ